jgi:hypothetical protein
LLGEAVVTVPFDAPVGYVGAGPLVDAADVLGAVVGAFELDAAVDAGAELLAGAEELAGAEDVAGALLLPGRVIVTPALAQKD